MPEAKEKVIYPAAKYLRVTIVETDEERHVLVIRLDAIGNVEVRRESQPDVEFDRSTAIDVGNRHCPVCIDNPDEICETDRQTLVISVESGR